MKKLFVSVCLLFNALTGNTATHPCQNATGTWSLDECWANEFDKTELKLDTKYKKILASLSKPDDDTYEYSAIRKAVINSQKAWLKLREVDCEAEYIAQPQPTGNTAPRMRLSCMIDYANRRIKRLDVFDPDL